MNKNMPVLSLRLTLVVYLESVLIISTFAFVATCKESEENRSVNVEGGKHFYTSFVLSNPLPASHTIRWLNKDNRLICHCSNLRCMCMNDFPRYAFITDRKTYFNVSIGNVRLTDTGVYYFKVYQKTRCVSQRLIVTLNVIDERVPAISSSTVSQSINTDPIDTFLAGSERTDQNLKKNQLNFESHNVSKLSIILMGFVICLTLGGAVVTSFAVINLKSCSIKQKTQQAKTKTSEDAIESSLTPSVRFASAHPTAIRSALGACSCARPTDGGARGQSHDEKLGSSSFQIYQTIDDYCSNKITLDLGKKIMQPKICPEELGKSLFGEQDNSLVSRNLACFNLVTADVEKRHREGSKVLSKASQESQVRNRRKSDKEEEIHATSSFKCHEKKSDSFTSKPSHKKGAKDLTMRHLSNESSHASSKVENTYVNVWYPGQRQPWQSHIHFPSPPPLPKSSA